jgi:hypothetical protein
MQAGVVGDLDLLVEVVGGGHPEGEAAVVNEGEGGKIEDVVEHCEEAVWPLWGDVALFALEWLGSR